MPRLARAPFAQSVAAAVVSMLVLALMWRVGATYDTAERLPRYAEVRGAGDSLAIVRAANDALQGRSSVEVPMVTTYFRRQGQSAMVSLRPVTPPGIVFRNVGGTVRILPDGRRVVIARE